MLTAVGLSTHIFNNNLKSAFLLLGYPLLLAGMIWLFGFLIHFDRLGPDMAAQAGVDLALRYGHWVVLGCVIWFSIAWVAHSSLIRAASGARKVTRQEYPEIYNTLENLCIARGMAMPGLQIIDTPALNAFASGLNEKTYAITLTTGIIQKLSSDELEAVLGHELTHIINRDVRLLMIGIIFVGMIGFFSELLFRSLIHGRRGFYAATARGRQRGGGGAVYIMLAALAALAVGYFFAIVIRLAISRRREYLADAGSVEMTKNPDAMMRALLRISGNDRIGGMPDDIEQMCIENSHGFMSLFATHPPIKDRIRVLSEMTNTPVPDMMGPWGARI